MEKGGGGEKWKDNEITKCSFEQILWKSKLAWRSKLKLQEVQLHLGNAGIPLHWLEGEEKVSV